MNQKNINRRDFIKIASSTTSLVLGILPNTTKLYGSSLKSKEFTPSAFVTINSDNSIIITATKSDMGQHVRTSLPMILSEELEADWNLVKVVQADANESKYGDQGTGGSGSVRELFPVLRKAGSAAKEMLIKAAAEKWGVDVNECKAELNKVIHIKTKKEFTFGQLVEKANTYSVPSNPKLKNRSDFKIIGKSMRGLDTIDKTNGSAMYGIDTVVPGMLYATIIKCPSFGSKLKSYDSSDALKVSGIIKIFEFDNKIAIVGKNTWSVFKAKSKIKVEWNYGEFYQWNSEKIKNMMIGKSNLKATTAKKKGNVQKAIKSSSFTLESTYELPFTAHATLEPMNCVAKVSDDSCEVWAPTQVPGGLKEDIVENLNFDPDNVKVHVTLLGGGFGRRLFNDYALECVEIAKVIKKPIKLTWDRETDLKHGMNRPASVHNLVSTFDKKNNPTSWCHKIISPSISAYHWGNNENKNLDKGTVGQGGINLPYEFKNMLIEYKCANTEVPIGWWRAVYNSQNAFANECFMDEIAYINKKDPIEFRKKLLSKSKRHLGVLNLVAEKSQWFTKKLDPNQGRGFAIHESFGSWTAQVVEITMKKDNTFSIDNVYASVDCGIVINPDGVKAQMEGCIVYGLSSAIAGELTIINGSVEQSNFHDFQLLSIDQMPKIHTYIVKSSENPTGAGEPGLPPIAPALGNAIFNATGKRLRKLPFSLT